MTSIRIIPETGSTNADLAAALRAGEPLSEGDWLVARRQIAGKGRQGREWHDGAGNFMGSTIVTIQDRDPPPASLSFVAALAVFEAASRDLPSEAQLELKWPNDVLLDGGKLSGILLEMVGTSVVVGIGVNLTQAPHLADRKTAALSDRGTAPVLDQFAPRLAEAFATCLSEWRSHGLRQSLKRFLSSSIHHAGAQVRVHDNDGQALTGTFAGLDKTDGALLLRLADGSERVIRAGDVS
ncbi:MAG: biotin--[acetyl-CoA-carboxylase] ligase [Pseudomonadota bacterium]